MPVTNVLFDPVTRVSRLDTAAYMPVSAFATAAPDVLQSKLSATVNAILVAGYAAYVPDNFEIANGINFELGDGAVMEIG